MNSDIKNWLIDWFLRNSKIEKIEIEKNLNINYFDANWIDSFGFISFVMEIEKSFNIRFSNSEFQDREFATLNGLEKIIEKRVNELSS
ncbi:hypothetical protein K9M16_04160 [Candidatus Babeliales bacterium]|nr:hypothetical protein [Candidatus Babeliales bacterium]